VAVLPTSPQLDVLSQFGGVLADFNGDGKLDLAAEINCPSNSYDFLLGDGLGTFNLASSNDVSNNGIGPAVAGDFNGDSRMDLATFDQSTEARSQSCYSSRDHAICAGM